MATKNVQDIVPGDLIPYTRTVTETRRTDTTVVLTYDDGTIASFDLALLPAIEVLDTGETTVIVPAAT